MIKSIWSKISRALKPETNPNSRSSQKQAEPQKETVARNEAKAGQSSSDGRRGNRRRGKSKPQQTKAAPKQDQRPWNLDSFQVPPAEGKTRFHDLGLPEPLLHAIADLSFQYCTPIQAEILPGTLAGKDAAGRAQTGTGKTAAFLICVITRLLAKPADPQRPKAMPRVLVLAPTRELVMQIADEARALCKYIPMNIASVFGGMDYEKQKRQLSGSRIDIAVATPGRLLDYQRHKEIDLSQVEIMIIDEADRMLDMGFIPDVRRIVYSTPHKSKRQTLLFSATFTLEVTRLAAQWTRDPLRVEIEPEHVAVETVNQVVYIVTREDKVMLLYNLIQQKNLDRVIVFCNRKDETRRLEDLFQRYRMNCAVLSGDIRQQKRIKTLEDFKAGKIKVLVATDVAGRGIHIEGMDHVINYTLPRDPEDYVHRIGRTGRAGASGTSISFADEGDSFFIPAIEELIGHQLPCDHPDESLLEPLPHMPKRPQTKRQPQRGRAAAGGRSRRPRGGRRSTRPLQGNTRRNKPPAKRQG
ncbi:MAG: DEAD/DEAH box helicase [Desulfosarcinaceae bacterium]